MIASASFDGTVVIWETQDSSMRHWDQIASLEGHDNEVKSVSWNINGHWLATCGRDKKVWIWEKLKGNDFECVAMLEGHTQDVKFVKWHPTENILYSASYDDTIKEWKEDNEDWYLNSTLTGHKSTVWGITINQTGKKLISCSDDRSIILWESDSGSWKQVSRINELHSYPIYSVDLNFANGLLATSGGDNSITINSFRKTDDGFDVINTDLTKAESHEGDVNCVRWNPSVEFENSFFLLSCGDDSFIKIWKYVII
jgi:WD40 repeat protein